MIELVLDDHCTGCDICVAVCPTNVFDAVPGGHPMIARQADCQTCFLCEVYCPADALYVAQNAEGPVAPEEAVAGAARLRGSYRRSIGWTPGTKARRSADQSHVLIALTGH